MPEQTPDFFDRYWDSVAAGQPGELTGVDPIQAETVRRFHAADDVSGPEPTFLDRLEEDLGLSSAESRAIRSGTYPRSSMNGYSVSPSRRPPLRAAHIPQQHRWRFVAGAVAALLLVLLGAGYVLFGSGLRDDDRPNTVPAAVAPTATPTPDVLSEGTVVEITIPAAVLPAGVAGSALDHETILPGTQSTWTIPQNAILRYIVAGTLTVRSGTPVSVLRAGARTWTDIPPDNEIELGPGDTVLFLYPTTFDIENAEATPVEMVGWIIESGTVERNPIPSDWGINDYALSGGGGVTTTGGPAVLRLERKVLAPGDTIPAAPEGVQQFVIAMPDNAAGTPVTTAFLIRGTSGKADNYGHTPMLVYVLTLTFAVPDASPPAGTPPP